MARMRNPFEKKSPPPPSPKEIEEAPPTVRKPEAIVAEQIQDEVPAKEVPGFERLEVVYTMEKKRPHDKPRPERNEDAALVDPVTGLLGVFDGLGGERNGAQASAAAARHLPDCYLEEKTRQELRTPEETLEELRDYIHIQTNDRIGILPDQRALSMDVASLSAERDAMIRIAEEYPDLAQRALALLIAMEDASSHVHHAGGLTTGCTALVHQTSDGKQFAVVANIGDSAAFLIPKNGSAKQITHDDSELNFLLESRRLIPALLLEMKRDPSKKYNVAIPSVSNLLNKLTGTSYYDISTKTMKALGEPDSDTFYATLTIEEMRPGDTLLLCTDGVIDKHEKLPTAQTTAANVMETMIDLHGLVDPFRVDAPLTTQADTLRVEASVQQSYKWTDDIAIVAARAKEE